MKTKSIPNLKFKDSGNSALRKRRSRRAGLRWTGVFGHALVRVVEHRRPFEHILGVGGGWKRPGRDQVAEGGRVGEHEPRVLNFGHVPCAEIAAEAVCGVEHSARNAQTARVPRRQIFFEQESTGKHVSRTRYRIHIPFT